MFERILIANRGEIACRIAASARRLGVSTVAVFSDADRDAAHVAACDEAWRLGPAPARESYLRGDRLIEIALARGAQAIHPGYGFLSENEAFARAVADAGLVFIGPPAAAIAAMGSKSAAKSLMEAARVPLVPGYHGERQEADYLRGQADAIGYPVLIKASAGGGGKGMRIVQAAEQFDEALASCRREAASAFGDERVLIERYLQRPRHIEIQVFADRHGQCVHLFERDCSVQRRHQKVVEEAPAPWIDEATRTAMGAAAVAAARAVGYEGAGTVEFIVEPDGRFYFMEMNTRLQVEHPVTEMITGQDLVEWQLRVAAGEPLPCTQDELSINGHAIEVRLYAEQPERGFLPSIGRIMHLRLPQASTFSLEGAGGGRAAVRLDGGVRAGDAITPHYDPMIAKLICWGKDRSEAIARMRQALAQIELVGPACNSAFLARLMSCTSFVQGPLDTGLIERERAELLPVRDGSADRRVVALAAAAVLARAQFSGGISSVGPSDTLPSVLRAAGDGSNPWSAKDGWRISGRGGGVLHLVDASDKLRAVAVSFLSGIAWQIEDAEGAIPIELLPDACSASSVCGLIDEQRFRVSLCWQGDWLHLFEAGEHHRLRLIDAGQIRAAESGTASSSALTAPMPGKIVDLRVAEGDQVVTGQLLLVLEAMKMEHPVHAPQSGRVLRIAAGVGDQVSEADELVVIGPAEDGLASGPGGAPEADKPLESAKGHSR
jgi:3-methylcrotonyl-CoA carboxylase alpha subunit